MERQELIRSMKMAANGADFITLTQLSRFLGQRNNDAVKKRYLIGLDRVGKKYFVRDVATRIMEGMQHEA